MKVIVVTDSVSKAAGGLLDAERCLHHGLCDLGVEANVFALEDSQTCEELPRWSPLQPKVFATQGPTTLGISKAMRRAILEESGDLVYRAGLWRMPSKYAHLWTRMHRKPEIIAPHGMLDPWAVRNSRWKKRLAHQWFEGAHLRDASCIRALCESEAQAVRAYGLRNPIAIVPNGINVPDLSDNRQLSTDIGPKVLLFLGRLHPKKGLVNALRAWVKVSSRRAVVGGQNEWQFVIAGWDQRGHEGELKNLCDELGVSWVDGREGSTYLPEEVGRDGFTQPCVESAVVFHGPAFGEEKDALLRSANAFILPSFSEGLPMSVLEAWSYRLPVLMTDHCNIPEGFAADAAIRIDTDVASIAEGMRLIVRSPISDLQSLGQNGRSLVERQFTWPQVAAQMKEIYEWVLGGGGVPDCVKQL